MTSKFYKIGFFILLILDVLAAIYVFNSSKERVALSQTAYIRDTIVSGDTAYLIDTVASKNIDSLKITSAEKHALVLADSVKMVKDSIDKVITFLNDSIKLKDLDEDQRNNFFVTFSSLASIKTRLDFRVDNERLALLNDERSKLEAVIKKFDKSKEKLNQLTKHLEKLASFIKIATDIFASALKTSLSRQNQVCE